MIDARKAIARIVDNMDGVTPGPWDADWIKSENIHCYGVLTDQGFICDTLNADAEVVEIFRDHDGEGDFDDIDIQGMRNMQHLSRCDPDTMRAIAALLAELDAEIERLNSALDRVEYQHDESGDSFSSIPQMIDDVMYQNGNWNEPICWEVYRAALLPSKYIMVHPAQDGQPWEYQLFDTNRDAPAACEEVIGADFGPSTRN